MSQAAMCFQGCRRLPLVWVAVFATALASPFLAGCGGSSIANPVPPTSPGMSFAGGAFTGKVLAGTTPISGASIQLYSAGTTGNAAGASALLSIPLLSDSAGGYALPVGYPCPTGNSQLYVIARGGSVVNSTATNSPTTPNPATVLAAPVGVCSSIAAGAPVVINEATTAATAWALAPFLAQDGTLGSPSSNANGLAIALANAQALIAASSAATPAPSFVSAALRVHTLANLLHTCVASTPACSDLFASTATTTTPADTLAAALSLVQNPGQNVLALFRQSTLSNAFTPALAKAPADWTLFLTLTGGGMNGPSAVAIDTSGDAWVSSFFSKVSEFSPSGTPSFPTGITGTGLSDSYGLAIDAAGNVWVPNREGGSANGGIGTVSELSDSGQPLSGTTGYAVGGLNFPIAVATDTNGSTWVVDYGNSHLTVLSASGQPVSGLLGYVSDYFAFPVAVAVDASHNAWVANQGGTSVTRISADGQTSIDSQCCDGASGLAIDRQGVVWVANYYGESVSQVSPTGAVLASHLTGGGIDRPQAIAVDGAGTVWVANYRGNTLSELAGSAAAHPGQPLSPATGWLSDAALSEPSGLAIDASGNLWISNFGASTLTEVIGLATPVKTPLVGPSQIP